ncbi:MAG: hypothetical protein ACW98J_10460 [Candidatus Thorarchaeota archaeon]
MFVREKVIDTNKGGISREVTILSSMCTTVNDKFAEEIRAIGPNPIRL